MASSSEPDLKVVANAVVWPWCQSMCRHLAGHGSKPDPLPAEWVAGVLEDPRCLFQKYRYQAAVLLGNAAPATPDADATPFQQASVKWAKALVQPWVNRVCLYVAGLGPRPEELSPEWTIGHLPSVKCKALRDQYNAAMDLYCSAWHSELHAAKQLHAAKERASQSALLADDDNVSSAKPPTQLVAPFTHGAASGHKTDPNSFTSGSSLEQNAVTKPITPGSASEQDAVNETITSGSVSQQNTFPNSSTPGSALVDDSPLLDEEDGGVDIEKSWHK